VGLPTITGTVTENQILTADNSSISDADGLGAFNYEWLRDGVAIGGATSSTYTLGDADVGALMSVEVSYTDGNSTAEGPLTSAQTAAVANVNDAPSGAVSIDNATPGQGDTLTASNTLADADGLSGPIIYQWQRDGVAIGGATGTIYTTVQADVGAVITVVATYTDDLGTPEVVSSAGTAAVTNVNNAPTLVLSSTVTSLAENADTSTRIKVADIFVTDDGMGSNVVSLSGADAALFEIDGTELFLKAGTVVDFDIQNAYMVAIQVDDTTVGATPDDEAVLLIGVVDINVGVADGTIENAVPAPVFETPNSVVPTVDPVPSSTVEETVIEVTDSDHAVEHSSPGEASATGSDGGLSEPLGTSIGSELEADAVFGDEPPVSDNDRVVLKVAKPSVADVLAKEVAAIIQKDAVLFEKLAIAPKDAMLNSIAGAVSLRELKAQLSASDFTRELDGIREDLLQQATLEQVVAGTALASSTSLAVGYVMWLFRGGALLSGFLSSMAAWQLADPLPILAYSLLGGKREGRGDEDSLESLVQEGSKAAREKRGAEDGRA